MGIIMIRNLLLLMCICTKCCYCSSLEIHVFNVGQANTVVFTTNTNALICDAGYSLHKVTEDYLFDPSISREGVIDKITELIKNKHLSVIITHQHKDHFNLLEDILNSYNVESKGSSFVLVGGPLQTAKKYGKAFGEAYFIEAAQNGTVVSKERSDATKKNRGTIIQLIKDCLGKEITVDFLLPKSQIGNISDNEHNHNLAVKITYVGHSILLLGDAEHRLIKQIAIDNPDCFIDTSIVIFSHHGSNESGELASIMEYLPSRSILGIISSDISGASRIPKFYPFYQGHKNTGLDFLQAVKKFVFPISEMSEKVFCASHNISFYNQLIDSPQTIPACLVDEQGISIVPVFSTGDMGDRGLFYKISIDTDGAIIMTRNADITHVLYRSSPGTGTTTSSSSSSSTPSDRTPVKVMSDLLTGTTNLIKQAVRDKETSFRPLELRDGFIRQKLDDPRFLIKLKYSSYTADTVKLSHLLELFRQLVALSATSSSPGIISRESINDILITSTVSAAQAPVLDREYVGVLWENKFLKRDINTLAKLLKKYKPDLEQSEKDIEAILSSFQSETIMKEGRIKRIEISKDTLATRLGIPNPSDVSISWVQAEATSILNSMYRMKHPMGKGYEEDSDFLEEDDD